MRLKGLDRVEKQIDVLDAAREQDYLDHSGQICPFCRDRKITATGQVEMDGASGFQNVHCMVCGREWMDIVELVGVDLQPLPE
jgi:hypothetical protein